MSKRAIKPELIPDEPAEPGPDATTLALQKISELITPVIAEDGELWPEVDQALKELITAVYTDAPRFIVEEISVYYPEQSFSPVSYHSFRCGNLFYKTVVKPGETVEEAYDRAWEFVSNQVHKQYSRVRRDFEARLAGEQV